MLYQPRVGIAAVVVKNHKILLGKRKGAHGAGEWACPGGHLEWGETPEACACRELLEETGLKAKHLIPGPWANNIFAKDKHYVTLFIYITQFEGQERVMEPLKCEGWKWFEWHNLPQPLFPTVQSLVQNVGLDQLHSIATLP